MAENEIGRLVIALEAQVQDVVSKLDSLEKTVKDFSGKTEEGFKKTESQWLKTAGGFLLGQLGIGSVQQAFGTLTRIISDAFKEFDEAIVTFTQLEIRLGEGAKRLQEYGAEQQKVTRYSDDAYNASSKLLSNHKLNEEQIRQLLPVIKDYAALTGRDLVSTAQAFGYAIQYGSTRGLRQFGIEVDKTGSQLDIFNELVKAGEGDVQGMAEKMGQLGSGPAIIVKNMFDEISEKLGEELNPQQIEMAKAIETAIIPAIENLIPIIGMWSSGFSELFRVWTSGFNQLTKNLSSLGAFIKSFEFKDLPFMLMPGVNLIHLFKKFAEFTPPVEGGAEEPSAGGGGGRTAWAPRGPYEGNVEELFKRRGSNLSDVKPGDMVGAGAVGNLAALNESIALEMDKLKATYEEGQLGAFNYYREITKLTGYKYDVEEDALKSSLAVATKEEDRAKIRDSLAALSFKRQRDMLAIKKQLNADELKNEEETNRNREALQENRLRSFQMMSDTMVDIGRALGEGLVSGMSEGVEGLRDMLSKIIITMLTFLEKYVLTVSMKGWLDEILKKGIMGVLTGGLVVGAITTAFALMKSAIGGNMEQGGMINGPRHSGGGVHINAEGGEYIEPRAAVAYYGPNVFEALRRMIVPRETFTSYNLAVAAPVGTAATGGMIGRGGVSIANFIDEGLFNRYLSSKAGQDAIVNVIRNNQFSINRG